MRRTLIAAHRFSGFLSEWSGRLMVIIVLYTIAMIVLNVVLRYVFRMPQVWGFDAIVYPMATAYALAGAYALRHGAHVNVDVLVARLSERGRAVLYLLTFPLLAMFCIALVTAGYDWAARSYRVDETTPGATGWPLFPFKAALPLGALLLLIQGTADFLRNLAVAIWGPGFAEHLDEPGKDDGYEY